MSPTESLSEAYARRDAEAIEVEEEYLWSLEVLAAHVFREDVTRSDHKKAKRIVANRTGRDAPYALNRADTVRSIQPDGKDQ